MADLLAKLDPPPQPAEPARCEVPGCGKVLVYGEHLCPHHWGMVPDNVKRAWWRAGKLLVAAEALDRSKLTQARADYAAACAQVVASVLVRAG